jgi:peroxiredoxin
VNSEKIAEANAVMQRNYLAGDSLKKVYANYQGTPKADSVGRMLDLQYSWIKEKEAMYLKKFIDDNTSSLASLAIIDRLNAETDVDYFVKLDKGLSAKYPKSDYVKMFHMRVSEMNKLGIGSLAPDISLSTPEGKTVSLTSYKGKVVLVDFWASWCRPCRAENPNVVKAYKEFHAKGFDVLGVSLDRDKAAWQKAIADDHLTWTHISDLGMWSSSVVKLYNISGIPFSVLLDKEGRIVAKGLRGEELENAIRKLLP